MFACLYCILQLSLPILVHKRRASPLSLKTKRKRGIQVGYDVYVRMHMIDVQSSGAKIER